MKRIFKQRVLITLIATAVGAGCGTLAGYLLGRVITLRLVEGATKIGELPLSFCGSLAENYEAHNGDYKGFLKKN